MATTTSKKPAARTPASDAAKIKKIQTAKQAQRKAEAELKKADKAYTAARNNVIKAQKALDAAIAAL